VRRWVLLATAILLLGAAANVGVAWWCALWSGVTWTPLAVSVSSTQRWPKPTIHDDGTRVMPFHCAGFGIDGEQIDEQQWVTRAHGFDCGARVTGGTASRAAFRAGWPLRCLEWSRAHQEQWERVDGTERRPRWMESDGIAAPYSILGRRLLPRPLVAPSGVMPIAPQVLLPVRPIWRAVVLNSLIYAGVLCASSAAIWLFVRKRRYGPGRCAACGYPVGLSDMCTECGRPVGAQGGSHGLPREEGSRAR
jgi:hypothetical protein